MPSKYQTPLSQAVKDWFAAHNYPEDPHLKMHRCPAHGDTSPSLDIGPGRDGRVVLHCHTGKCSEKDILAAVGLTGADVHPNADPALVGRNGEARKMENKSPVATDKQITKQDQPLTAYVLAAEKRISFQQLSIYGVKDNPKGGVIIRYQTIDGKTTCRQRIRTSLVAKQGSYWAKDDRPILPYGLWHIPAWRGKNVDMLWLTEGESDCWALWQSRTPALGIPGADMAGKLQSDHLTGITHIWVSWETDDGGDAFIRNIYNRLREIGYTGTASAVRMPKPHKDPSALWIARPDQDTFADALLRAQATAVPLHEAVADLGKPKLPVCDAPASDKSVKKKTKAPQAQADDSRFLPDELRPDPKGADGIIITGRHPHAVLSHVLSILHTSNTQAIASADVSHYPLFQGAAGLCYLYPDALRDGDPTIDYLDDKKARAVLVDRGLLFYRFNNGAYISIQPPAETVQQIVGYHRNFKEFPLIRQIVRAPFYGVSGKIISTPGYNEQEQIWYEPGEDLRGLVIPENPTAAQITSAKTTISSLMVDFPFESDSDLVNYIGLLLLPFMRPWIGQRSTPLHLIESATPRSGKTLLANMASVIATGSQTTPSPAPSDPVETPKWALSILLSGAQIVCIDNLPDGRALDSATLAATITAAEIEGRILGQTKSVKARNMCTWIATGNNPSLSRELTDRSVRIRITPPCERPGERTDFRIPNILDHVRKERKNLVAAVLTLIANWHTLGRPATTEAPNMGGFESWRDVIGGILYAAGIGKFLENQSAKADDIDQETVDWRDFVERWVFNFQEYSVSVKDLLPMATEAGVFSPKNNETDHAQVVRFGSKLRKKIGVIYASHRIAKGDSALKNRTYRLQRVG